MFSNFTSRVHLCDACAQTRSLHGCQLNTPEIYLSPSFALLEASRRHSHAVCTTWRCFENNGGCLRRVCSKHGVEVRNLISRSGVLASVTRTRLRGRQPPGGPGRDAAHTADGARSSPPAPLLQVNLAKCKREQRSIANTGEGRPLASLPARLAEATLDPSLLPGLKVTSDAKHGPAPPPLPQRASQLIFAPISKAGVARRGRWGGAPRGPPGGRGATHLPQLTHGNVTQRVTSDQPL